LYDSSGIRFQYPGTYNIQFSTVYAKSTANSALVDIWFSLNGNYLTSSNTSFTIAGQSDAVASWNFIQTVNANDFMQIYWSCPDTSVSITYVGTQSNPIRPAVPSVIITAQQIMYTQIGPTGSQGPQGDQGASGPQGDQGASGPLVGFQEILNIGNTFSGKINVDGESGSIVHEIDPNLTSQLKIGYIPSLGWTASILVLTDNITNCFYTSGPFQSQDGTEGSGMLAFDTNASKLNYFVTATFGIAFGNGSGIIFLMDDQDANFYSYPNTRDDESTTTPTNFLYTDSSGKMLSTSLSKVISSQNVYYVDNFTGDTIILPHLPSNSPMVIMNGLVLSESDGFVTRDYSIVGSTITLISIVANKNFQIRYEHF